ncbi:MAG: MmcQ/YjbR family DNA-binding protein [Muribaculaceae bacterium]|nr:MmcQ/YjbR family DNA-binding protein [Muribaculaceae bacterium]
MNIEAFREYCLSLPFATEDMAFGDDYLLFRLHNKIFACAGLVRTDYFTVKMNADTAIEYREKYAEIEPAWHWNKKYWSQISLTGTLPDDFIHQLIDESYREVLLKLPKRMQSQISEAIEEHQAWCMLKNPK